VEMFTFKQELIQTLHNAKCNLKGDHTSVVQTQSFFISA
jgi:hypothetical protein